MSEPGLKVVSVNQDPKVLQPTVNIRIDDLLEKQRASETHAIGSQKTIFVERHHTLDRVVPNSLKECVFIFKKYFPPFFFFSLTIWPIWKRYLSRTREGWTSPVYTS